MTKWSQNGQKKSFAQKIALSLEKQTASRIMAQYLQKLVSDTHISKHTNQKDPP